MSKPNLRVVDFLNKAQAINTKTKELETRCSPLCSGRTGDSSLFVREKASLSPISSQSFSSTYEDTPVPPLKKFVLSGTFTNKKTTPTPSKEKIEKTISKPLIVKEPKDFIQEDRVNDKIKLPSSSKPTQIPGISKTKEIAIKEIEQKGKIKMQKMIEIFREEALKMDKKLQLLQEENLKLKQILRNPQLPQAKPMIKNVKNIIGYYAKQDPDDKLSHYLEDLCLSCRKSTDNLATYEKIDNWFGCLDIDQYNLNNFTSSVCKKIQQEEKKRFKTEEDTGKIIESEENIIKELEIRVGYAETMARKGSCRIICEPSEPETPRFDRNKVLGNLSVLLEKTKDS
ncbi:hypothetical protein SteCoe_13911 [Stentor coeruleus]|uniref:Uncharacterized protein n=1 Tax=Stentor coeruleus TaxID=5963 RepID=A0A1R2C7L1_9CILI|nr:hypothetical protein SteCoe_13911 [Stentor coeruleus]